MPKQQLGVVSDALAALSTFGLSYFLVNGSSSLLKPCGGVTFAVLLIPVLSLFFRRRAPLAVMWVTIGMTSALLAVEIAAPGTVVRSGGDARAIPLWPPAAPFAAYSVIAYAKPSPRTWAPVMALATLVLLAVPAMRGGQVFPGIDSVPMPRSTQPSASTGLEFRSTAFILGGAILGMYVSARRREHCGLTERAERAERERHLFAEQARVEERARLAAEMHDVVSHRVSLMVVHAGAMLVSAPDSATREAADQLRTAGCQALEELRDVVGLLRDTVGDGYGPRPEKPLAPAYPDLTSLIRESASVGVPVELVEEGDQSLASPVVSRTVYRVVQEALTNVRKHAPGARVSLRLHCRGDGIHLTIRNTAPTRVADALLTAAGSGTGLAGLTQRVELVQGTLEVGPEDNGGFCVRATLPAYVPTTENRSH
ncbi:sensor histidine kinase [Streptomyces sp. NPDC048516]|uniref:sensor histidine kinase n=1 Tax=Streptomyces sp. NPDC048516 TaxID=3365565 RepID=UPI003710F752